MVYKLADLEKLKALAPGTTCCIHHDIFADLFPPGEPDEAASGGALNFAKAKAAQLTIAQTNRL